MTNTEPAFEGWRERFLSAFACKSKQCSFLQPHLHQPNGEIEPIVTFIEKEIARAHALGKEEGAATNTQEICEIVVDEFEELMLSFHPDEKGERILKTQEQIVKRLQAIQTTLIG